MLTSAIVVLTTTETREEAQSIASGLLEQQLAACIQIGGPVTSVFRWEGAVENCQEWQLWIKTRHSHFEQVEQVIRRLHSYDEPEVIALPITVGSLTYLNWLYEETGGKQGAQ